MLNVSTTKAFHTWLGYAEGVSAAFGSLERASRRMLNVSTSKAFHTWAGYAEGVSGALQNVSQALGHWTYALLSIGWHAWATYVDGTDVARRRLQQIVVQVHAVRTGFAFSAWDTWLRERASRLLAAARRAAAFWLSKGASGAIKRWVTLRTQKHLTRRSLGLYMQRHLRVSWCKWALFKHKAVPLTFVLEQDFDTWTQRSSLRFGAFFKQAFGVRLRDVHVRRLNCMLIALHRCMLIALPHCMLIASLLRDVQVRRGSVILTAVANLPQQALVDLCRGKHRERLINDFRCGPIRVGKSGKGNGTLSRVFNRFKGLVRVPRLLRGANRSRHLRSLSASWAVWSNWRPGPSPPMNRHQSRVAARWRNRPLSKAFDAWEARTAERLTMRRVALRFTHRSLGAVWVAWEALCEKRRVMRCALAALMHSELRRGLVTWLEMLAERAQTQAVLARALASLRVWVGKHAYVRAWRSWLDTLATYGVQRRAFAFVRSLAVIRALTSWQEYLHMMQLLRRADGGFLLHSTARALRMWSAVASRCVEVAALCRSTMLASRRRGFVRAFRAFAACTVEALHRRHAIAHSIQASLARALTSWVHLSTLSHVELELWHRALGMWPRTLLTAGWELWRIHVASLRLGLGLRTRAQRACRTGRHRRAFDVLTACIVDLFASAQRAAAARTFRQRSSFRGWASWRAHEATLEPLRIAAARMRHVAAGRALRGWLAVVGDAAHARARMQAALHAGMRRALTRAFTRWSTSHAERELKLCKMRTTLQALAGSPMSEARWFVNDSLQALAGGHRILRAFNTWKFELHAAVHRLRAASALLERLALDTFRGWAAVCAYERFVVAAFAHWRHRSLRRSVRRWRKVGRRLDLQASCVACAHYSQCAIRIGLRTWLGALEKYQMLVLALAAFGHFSARRALKRWCMHAATHGLVRHKERAVAGGRYATMRFAALRRWQSAVVSEIASLRRLSTAVEAGWRAVAGAFLRKLREAVAHSAHTQSLLLQWRQRRVGHRLYQWRVRYAWASHVARVHRLLAHLPEWRALSRWMGRLQIHRRLHMLAGSFRPLHQRRAWFRTWRDHTRRPPLVPLGAPSHLRPIRSMTWRECCTWLGSEGIRVSHSPPVLLRALRTGAPYKELVRRIAPPFWVRHKLARVHDPRMLFGLIQQLFDAESFVHVLGCQRLAVGELVDGKALEHLELLAVMREVLELRLLEQHGMRSKESPKGAKPDWR
jgi:hypothetical protein